MVGILGTKRTVVLLCAVAVATLVVVLALALGKPARAATDRLPDLRMARLGDFKIKKCADRSGDCDFAGQLQLRFDSIIVNTGAGAFEVRGARPNTTISTMTVRQRIYDDAGGYRTRPTTAQMYFAGDGHDHWHLRNLARYKLIRLDNGVNLGRGAKQGFCFRDNHPFGSSRPAYYTRNISCGGIPVGDPSALRVRMGLSRGWADKYWKTTVDQFIDITGLLSGRYRLRTTADAGNWFLESNNSNNFTWTDIRISGTSISVIRRGPAAQPI
jgi:hypothetical protein